MPYADKEQQRAAQAAWYRKKYQRDPKFAEKESDRKAEWLQTEAGKESNAAASSRFRVMRKRASFLQRWLVAN